MADRMLRCATCDKPVLLMSADQAARRDAHPEHYEFVCLQCTGDSTAHRWPTGYEDDGG